MVQQETKTFRLKNRIENMRFFKMHEEIEKYFNAINAVKY